MAGQVVVLNFWASWCTPCKNEMPAFEMIANEGAADLQIIGVDIKNDRVDDAQDLLTELGITYDIAIDSGGEHQLYGPIEQALGLGGSYPVTVFIRPDGVIDVDPDRRARGERDSGADRGRPGLDGGRHPALDLVEPVRVLRPLAADGVEEEVLDLLVIGPCAPLPTGRPSTDSIQAT